VSSNIKVILTKMNFFSLFMGVGKTTYTFSANTNGTSANFPFSVLPAGGAGKGQAAETESTLALAENVYVSLPTPFIYLEATRIS
jgi:hypothetical protein